MPAPPSRSTFSGLPKDEFQKMELMIETLEMINEAISDYADKVCSPPSPQDFSQGSNSFDCIDKHDMCSSWADAGECEANVEFMMAACRLSCKNCTATEAETATKDVQGESGTIDTSTKSRKSSDYEKSDYESKDYGNRYKGVRDTIASTPFEKSTVDDYKTQASQDTDDYIRSATDYSDSVIRAKAMADLSKKHSARSVGERSSYDNFYSIGQLENNGQKARNNESGLIIITGLLNSVDSLFYNYEVKMIYTRFCDTEVNEALTFFLCTSLILTIFILVVAVFFLKKNNNRNRGDFFAYRFGSLRSDGS